MPLLLVLGSGARQESALGSDQDHALVLAGDAPPGAGDWFAALTERLAATLERCGLPRCPGEVMATNPAWRAPLGVWQDRFLRWIEQPDEDALLEAAIFFDFRQLHAELPLRRVIQAAAGNRRFLGRLAAAALRRRPAAGLLWHLGREHRAGSTSRWNVGGPPRHSRSRLLYGSGAGEPRRPAGADEL
jgi:CBS domain-containing protein